MEAYTSGALVDMVSSDHILDAFQRYRQGLLIGCGDV